MKSPQVATFAALSVLLAVSTVVADSADPTNGFRDKLVKVVEAGLKPDAVAASRAEFNEKKTTDQAWTEMDLVLYDMEAFARDYPNPDKVDGDDGLRAKLKDMCGYLKIDEKRRQALDATYFPDRPSPEVQAAIAARLKSLKVADGDIAAIKEKLATGNFQDAGNKFDNSVTKPQLGTPEYVAYQEVRRALAPKPQVEFTQGYKSNLNSLVIHEVPLGPRSDEDAADFQKYDKEAKSGKKAVVGGAVAAGTGIIGGIAIATGVVSAPVWVPVALVGGGLLVLGGGALWLAGFRRKREAIQEKDKDNPLDQQ